MTLKEHYGFNRRKSIKPYIKLFLLIVLIMLISPTFSKYSNSLGSSATLPIAKWQIRINNELVTSQTNQLTNSLDLLNVSDNTNQIDSGDTCYFDILIDPSLTEVAISYSINVDLVLSSDLPSGSTIVKYEKYIYTNNIETLDSTTNLNANTASISENILLPNNQTALSSVSKVKYRFYCKIPFPADITKDDALTVTPNISIEQYIR